MKIDTSFERQLIIPIPNVIHINWRLLLRKYKNGSISLSEECKLRFYAELYGINLED